MPAILLLQVSTSRSKPALDLHRVDGDPRVERWWDVSLKSLSKQGVGERSLVWCRRRVEQLARRQPGLPSNTFTAQAVTGHLTAMDGLGLPAWQLLQAVDAIAAEARTVNAPCRNGSRQTTRLTAQQFLQRFVRHQLPRGLRRLRMAGFLAPRVRRQRLEQARRQLAHRSPPPPAAAPQPDRQAPAEPGVRRCPCCGQRSMLVCLLVRPVRSGPPVIVVPQRWRDHRARAPTDPVGDPVPPVPEHRSVAGPPPVAVA